MSDTPKCVLPDGTVVDMNADQIKQWNDAVNAPSTVSVPTTVSNYQARAQLYADGNFDVVDKAVRASGNPSAIAAWDYANNFDRSSKFITAFKASTPYNTDALVDTFFINAAKQN